MTPETERRIVEHLARVTFPGMEILQEDTGIRVCARKELGWSSLWNPLDPISDAMEALEGWRSKAKPFHPRGWQILSPFDTRSRHIPYVLKDKFTVVLREKGVVEWFQSADTKELAICEVLAKATGLEVEK